LPENKELLFLGPHGKTLAEAPGSLPTVTLLAGNAEPVFYARLVRNIQKNVTSEFTELTAGTASQGRVMDYSLMHYEKTPQEELTLAVLLNRQNALHENIDILSITPAAGRDKKLSDVLNAMDKTGMYAKYNYKKLIFVACREDKRRGAISAGLGDSYQIQFKATKSDLAALSLNEPPVAGKGAAPDNAKALAGDPRPRVRRHVQYPEPAATTTLMPETTTADEYETDSDESEFIDFDGILVFEKLTITLPEKKMSSEVLGILPYINPPLSHRKE
ncbi:putative adhesin, partial [Kosakonia oryzendophytica]|uniref:putative adhesin n=1 Tax=Kosakonia oryzendophytica TaxID=1005665 RepID=UPI003D352860